MSYWIEGLPPGEQAKISYTCEGWVIDRKQKGAIVRLPEAYVTAEAALEALQSLLAAENDPYGESPARDRSAVPDDV